MHGDQCSIVAPHLALPQQGNLVMKNLMRVTANIRSIGLSNKVGCKKKLMFTLTNLPDVVCLSEVCVTAQTWGTWWNLNRFELAKYTGVFLENGKRGIIVLLKIPIVPESSITLNENVQKISLMLDGRSLAIFAIYAPSHGNNARFFNELRKSQLDSKEQFQIITGDLNTTLDPELDKVGYISDNHWKTREVINSWLDDDHHGLIDAYSYCKGSLPKNKYEVLIDA